MTLSFIHLGLIPFLRLLTTTVVAGWMSSPMSWSPDGEWLSYTVARTATTISCSRAGCFVTSNGFRRDGRPDRRLPRSRSRLRSIASGRHSGTIGRRC